MTRAAVLEGCGSVLPTPSGYLQQATLPWPSLVFLLPLIFTYEVGTQYFTSAALRGQEQQIIAFSKMQQFFRLVGATGRHMPAMAVIAMLLGWHLARRDTWKIDIGTIIRMGCESALLGLPLLLLAYLVNHYLPLIGLRAELSQPHFRGHSTVDRLVMDIGAGVYEEFVFRLVMFTVLSLLLKDILRLPDKAVYLLMVVISGVLFSVYHYWSPTEHFVFRIFAFRALAGIYCFRNFYGSWFWHNSRKPLTTI